jgi:hypothetical protein
MNFTANPGSGGSVFASDTISTVEYPLAKSAWGAAGSVNQTSAAAPMPVTVLTTPVAVTGAIVAASTVVGPLTMGSWDGATVTVSGTHAGVNFGFWGSLDNTLWFPVNACRVDTSISETTTGVLTSNSSRAWDIDIGEFLYFRVVATAWTSGSAAINITPGAFAAAPTVAAIAQGPAAAATATAGNPVRIGGTFVTTQPTYTTGQQTDLQTTNRGEVLAALSVAGVLASIKAASTAPLATDPALVVTISPNLPVPTTSFVNSAATTNATSVKASAGTVYNITASNTGAAAAFVKFYNKATAPTVGTDVPVFTIAIPASGTVTIAPAMLGIRFSTGIALAITNLAADTDTTVIAAAQVKVATSYI